MFSQLSLILFTLVVAIVAATSTELTSEVEVAKRERRFKSYMIPMPDGIELHTNVILPKGCSFDSACNVTAVLDRSPYGYGGIEQVASLYLPFGFAAVGQDMRGTEKSEGNFSIWHSDAIDGATTINWLAGQVWSSGFVLSTGGSADGLASYTLLDTAPEPLDAQFIIWSSSTGYPIIYPGGAYRESLADTWMQDTVRPDEVSRCLNEIYENEQPDEWWEPLNMTVEGGKFDKITWPSLHWAGWYDIFLVGQLSAFEGYKNWAAPNNDNDVKIFIDPLGHCQEAAVDFPHHTIAGRSALPVLMSIDLMMSTVNGKDWGNATDHILPYREEIKDVTFYVMGGLDDTINSNYWTSLDSFPAFKEEQFFLRADFSLSDKAETSQDSIAYTYDPLDPVPSMGGNNLFIPCGPYDQADNLDRDDILVFTSDELREAYAITGPISAHLEVSSDAVDTDFMVKLIDVYPNGEHRLIQEGAVRMRNTIFRDMQEDETYAIDLDLWNSSYVFGEGHAIAVTITSSNYPRFSVNPNNGRSLVDPDLFTDATTAVNTVYIGDSFITLPKVNLIDLPRAHVIEEINERFPEYALAGVMLAEARGGKVDNKNK